MILILILILLLLLVGKKLNKKSLISISDSDYKDKITSQLNQIKDKIEADKLNSPSQPKSIRNYLSNDDNKLFHLEIIKRSFISKPKYITPQDFQPVVLDYFDTCYKYNKLPTIVRSYFFCWYYSFYF